MKTLTVIPIRKGSQRLPNKNFLLLDGKPLFMYIVLTLAYLLASGLINKIVITTDATQQVIQALQKEGVRGVTVLKRSKHLCTKDATSVEVAIDVVKEYPMYDYILFCEPTMPFIKANDLEEMVKHLTKNNLSGIATVNRFNMKPVGSVILVRRDVLLKEKTLYPKNIGVYLVDGEKNIDVDDYYDFLIACAYKGGRVYQ